jgi:hypothetical protein
MSAPGNIHVSCARQQFNKVFIRGQGTDEDGRQVLLRYELREPETGASVLRRPSTHRDLPGSFAL